MNDENIFDIELETDGAIYRDGVNPFEKLKDDGLPVSFHVVLNKVSVGKEIAQHYKLNELKGNA